MPGIWRSVSVSLVLLRDRPLFQSVIPSKILESLAMKRPVILGVRGESAEILRESEGGIAITPEDADELADTVELLAEDRARCRTMGAAGSRFVTEHFDRRKLASQYAVLLQELVR
jgi:glycosyltransferase involved in cell wall biosynthesis